MLRPDETSSRKEFLYYYSERGSCGTIVCIDCPLHSFPEEGGGGIKCKIFSTDPEIFKARALDAFLNEFGLDEYKAMTVEDKL